MKDHNSGAEGPAEERGGASSPAPNVVPFPRAWYGSVDELVPISPAPSVTASPRADSLADASAFWGGEATKPSGPDPIVENAVNDPSTRPLTPPADWQEDEALASPEWQVVSEPLARNSDGVASESPQVKPNQPERRRALPGGLALALLALLVAVTVIAALGGGNGPAKENKTAGARTPALTVTQTVPQTSTVVQTVTTGAANRAHHRRPRHTEPTAVTTEPKQATSAADSVSHSPTQSHPTSNPTSDSVTPAGGGGSSPPSTGSSKPSCAPSVTNGGACSL